jgi:DNA-binding winged helix-turn-helix (wHTH) protein
MTSHWFGPFRLDVDERRLWCDGKLVQLGGKAFDTLRLLVEGSGRLQTHTSLIDRLWPNVTVEPNNLQFNISLVRRALAGAPGVQIETVRGQGYRLHADIQHPPLERNATPDPILKDGFDVNIDIPSGAPAQRLTIHLGERGIKLSVQLASGDTLSRELPVTASAMNISRNVTRSNRRRWLVTKRVPRRG